MDNRPYEEAQALVEQLGTEHAEERGSALIRAAAQPEQLLGIHVLGLLAADRANAAAQLVQSAAELIHSTDQEIRLAVTRAVGGLADNPAAASLLLDALNDPDLQVRVAAVRGMGVAVEDPQPRDPCVVALIELLNDPAAEIRDWSAFVLGSQWEVDSPELRDALFALASDDESDEHVAAEAALGLAVRGDRRVIAIIRGRLATPHVGKLWLRAAGEARSRSLLPALHSLRRFVPDDGDDWDLELAAALEACASAGSVE